MIINFGAFGSAASDDCARHGGTWVEDGDTGAVHAGADAQWTAPPDVPVETAVPVATAEMTRGIPWWIWLLGGALAYAAFGDRRKSE